MIYWIIGQSGAGKSTLAKLIAPSICGSVHLDGDALRLIWPGLGFSNADRLEQNWRTARLAAYLAQQNYTPIVSTICPFRKQRMDIDSFMQSFVDPRCRIRWIHLPGGRLTDAEHPFEPPD